MGLFCFLGSDEEKKVLEHQQQVASTKTRLECCLQRRLCSTNVPIACNLKKAESVLINSHCWTMWSFSWVTCYLKIQLSPKLTVYGLKLCHLAEGQLVKPHLAKSISLVPSNLAPIPSTPVTLLVQPTDNLANCHYYYVLTKCHSTNWLLAKRYSDAWLSLTRVFSTWTTTVVQLVEHSTNDALLRFQIQPFLAHGHK